MLADYNDARIATNSDTPITSNSDIKIQGEA